MCTDEIVDHLVGSSGLDVSGQGDFAFRRSFCNCFEYLDRLVTQRITKRWQSRFTFDYIEYTHCGSHLFCNG